MTKRSLVQSAAILSAAGLICKFLGATFRIPLANWIGSEGMANYSPAYQLYAFLLVIATAGVPVAISKLTAERNAVGKYKEAYRVFRISRALMFALGLTGALILFFFSDFIAELINVPGSSLSMKATALALVLVPIMSAYRGFFQGMQEMKPTAYSQIVEQVFRVVIGLLMAVLMMKGLMFAADYDVYERGAAGGCFGATAGGIGGLGIMMIIYFRNRITIRERIDCDEHTHMEPVGKIIKKIVAIAIPVSIGSAIMPIVNLTDGAVVVTRLMAAGYDQTMAKAMYGQLSGFAQPLISFPQVFMQAIVLSIVPMVAAAVKLGNNEEMKTNVILSLRMAAVIAIPCAVGLIVLAEPSLLLLYPAQKADALAAVPCMQILAVGFIFSGLISAMTGVLQGIGKQNYPVINLAIGVLVKIIITWSLTAVASINIIGAAIGTMCAFIVAATLDFICVRKFTGVRIPVGLTVVKPLVSSLVMGVAVKICYLLLSTVMGSGTSTLISILLGVCVYALMILKTRAIYRDELQSIKGGGKIVKICDKLKLW